MTGPIHIRALRTRYPHWGAHAGLHQFLAYLDPERFRVRTELVSDGDDDFPLRGSRIRGVLRGRVQRRGMTYYKLSDLAAETRVLRRCLTGRIDLVHYLDGEHTAQYLPPILARLRGLGVRTLASFHQPPELLEELLRPEIVARLDHVTVVAAPQLEFFRRLLPDERISLILHGVDVDFFRPPAAASDGNRRFRCITVGHWLRDWEALRGVAAALSQRTDIELHVVTARETGLEAFANVTLHRDLDDDQLLRLYQGADLLLLPLTAATATNTLLEAMACGLPVVTSRLPALDAYLGPEAGVRIAGNLASDLADAVLRLAGDREGRVEMGLRARQAAELQCWRAIAPRFGRLYGELAAGAVRRLPRLARGGEPGPRPAAQGAGDTGGAAPDGSRRLFCSKPFEWFETTQLDGRGGVYLCCPSWLDTPVGNLRFQSVDEIWNGGRARDIRRSILDGSFDYCSRSRCPYLQTVSGPVQPAGEVRDERLREVMQQGTTLLPYGPRKIICTYDQSCNLSCPSCRTRVIVENAAAQEILGIQSKLEQEALGEAEFLYMTGSGDPFGSPFFRKWLQTMKKADVPKLERIHLQSNGLLWSPRMWGTISSDVRKLIRSAEISMDAATPETYAINRREGNFEKLLRNLEFIASLRRDGPLEYVKISMVVQENNFQEMPGLVAIGRRFGFDVVYFSQLVNWGTFTDAEFAGRAVHIPRHPRHAALLQLLQDPVFQDPIVDLGNLTEVRLSVRQRSAGMGTHGEYLGQGPSEAA